MTMAERNSSIHKNEIVKYHNDMASVSMPKFSPTDLNIFNAVLYKAKGRGTREFAIYIDELMELSGFKSKDRGRFLKYLDELTDKILDLKYKEKRVGGATRK